MKSVFKSFRHSLKDGGVRTAETDALSLELATHALQHEHPTVAEVDHVWTDEGTLFVFGLVPEDSWEEQALRIKYELQVMLKTHEELALVGKGHPEPVMRAKSHVHTQVAERLKDILAGPKEDES